MIATGVPKPAVASRSAPKTKAMRTTCILPVVADARQRVSYRVEVACVHDHVVDEDGVDDYPDYREEPERDPQKRGVERQPYRHPVDQNGDDERYRKGRERRPLRCDPDPRQQHEEHHYGDGGHQRRECQATRDRLVDLLVHETLPPMTLPTSELSPPRYQPRSSRWYDNRSMALPGTRRKSLPGLYLVLPGDERHAQVVDVGAGRACDEGRSSGLERRVRIVVRQRLFWVDPALRMASRRRAVYQPARGVCGAVVAVGVRRERRPALRCRRAQRPGRGRTPGSGRPHRPREPLPWPRRRRRRRRAGERVAALQDLPITAAYTEAAPRASPVMLVESNRGSYPSSRAFATAASAACRPLPQIRFTTLSKTGSPGFGGLRGVLQVLGDALGRFYAVAFEHPSRVVEGRRVWGGEAAGYRGRVVAHHVGEEEGEGGRGVGERHQAAAFEHGDVLADGVDLAYVRPASQQRPGELLQVRELNWRRGVG